VRWRSAQHSMPASRLSHTAAAYAVVECYSEWAGPCKSVVSTLKSLFFSMSERPIKFYTVSLQQQQLLALR
jgi:hypothetical protein